jgi:translation initiation factor IF-3
MARQQDLDLVEVAPSANPPVCRIMDYGKFRYEESQKAKESRKKTIQVSIKEVKFRPKIGKGDFDTKVRHMQDFLEEGHKVKVTLQFRGREMAHPELGSKILDAVIEQLGPTAKVEAYARLEGRNMTMVLAPEKKIVKKESRQERREAQLANGAAEAGDEPVYADSDATDFGDSDTATADADSATAEAAAQPTTAQSTNLQPTTAAPANGQSSTAEPPPVAPAAMEPSAPEAEPEPA